jgi:hypothetical protein
MESGGDKGTHMGTRAVYRIVVRSELSERYARAFEGIEMETRSGQTILTGEVIDDALHHGILDRIIALGLELVSVESLPTETSRQQVSHASMPVRPEQRPLDS